MSRGIFEALNYIKNMIQEIDPKTDTHQGFISIDDGSAGLSGRKRTSVEIQVRYSIPKEAGFRVRMMNEDASKIIDKIKGPQYNFNETGIVSVIPGQSRLEEITDINGVIVAHVLIVPFDLLYLEA